MKEESPLFCEAPKSGVVRKRKVECAELKWCEGEVPRELHFDDVYYDAGDGYAETCHVFLEQNDLSRRFKSCASFSIGELGFGMGLNFLASWKLWLAKKSQSACLHYLSFELFPVSKDDLRRSHKRWPELSGLSRELLGAIPDQLREGVYPISLGKGEISLTLIIGGAEDYLPWIRGNADAWYLDGFSPRKNPELWTAEVFSEVARCSLPGTTLSTYSVAGGVRARLEEAGFLVEKRQGTESKRDISRAVFVGFGGGLKDKQG